MPVLHESIKLEQAITGASKNDLNLFFDQSGENFHLLNLKPKNCKLTAIFIGPEGGWDPQELDLVRKSNFKIINLSKLTLRAETAAIIGSYCIIHNF